jgi:hypothetical protein
MLKAWIKENWGYHHTSTPVGRLVGLLIAMDKVTAESTEKLV